MKFKNSTDFADSFLRKMLTWAMRETEVPRKAVRSIAFENRSAFARSGRCWFTAGRIVCGIGSDEHFPHKDARDRDDYVEADRTEGLIYILAHELYHIFQYRSGRLGGGQRIEKAARNAGYQAVFAFRAKREELLAHWSRDRKAPEKPALTRKERNYQAALAKLKAWERKAKLAQTKLKTYRAAVRRYERDGLGSVAADGGN